MRWFIILLVCLFSIPVHSQSLDSIKHIELISEVSDSMALINKEDINKVNKVFYDKNLLDSLNKVNLELVNLLMVKTEYLDSILVNQKSVINNQEKTIMSLQHNLNTNDVKYKELLNNEINKKNFWKSSTFVSVLSLIIILLV